MKLNTVAMIPARGGSKRIPKKNIIDFHGEPMICRTIRAAQNSNIFDDIVVNTDDDEIAKISELNGIHTPFIRRSGEDDYTNISDVTINFIKQYNIDIKKNIDVIVVLLPNCPLRDSSDIIKAYNFFNQNNRPIQISAVKFGWMNPWWAHTIDKFNVAKKIFNDLPERSQDLDELYCPTGAIWIANVKVLLERKSFYSGEFTFFPMDWQKGIDIDTYDDLELAKLIKIKNECQS